MSDLVRMFDESKVKRGTGATGGQFSSKGGAAPARPAGKGRPSGTARARADGGNLSFDGKRGTGYGKAGGDKRVAKLQAALNRLGLTDSAGKALKVDGKLGPKTTAAIKKAQRALGMKADGVVTPALLRKLTTVKSLKKPAAAAPAPDKKRASAPARKPADERVKADLRPKRKTTAAPRRTSRNVKVSTS